MRFDDGTQLSCRGEGLVNKMINPIDHDQLKKLLFVVNDDISVIEEEIKRSQDLLPLDPSKTNDNLDTKNTR